MSTRNSGFLLFAALVSALGGFLFGYDWVVVGGAKPFYEVYFDIAHMPHTQGWVMGSAIIGCLLGVMLSGSLADRYGRRPLLFVAAIIFVGAAAGTGAVSTLSWFIVLRVAGGIGIGIASNLSPIYIAEIAPGHSRGKFVSINQLTIVLGILSAQLANWLIAEPVAAGADMLHTWNVQMGWRWMFWAGGVPAVLFFCLLFLIPESPRWLASKQRYKQVGTVLRKLLGTAQAQEQLASMQGQAQQQGQATPFHYRQLLQPHVLRILLLGVVIAVFQQWCGINVIFNYAQEIFSSAGYGVSDILFNIVITGVTNVVFTLVGMYTVDRLGRRSLMLIGASGLAAIYAVLGACYYYHITGVAVLLLVVLAIGCYAMTLAPVTWVVLSEIFPMRMRAAAMGIATFALWTACFVLTYTFPLLNSGLGAYGTFWLYGIICVLGFVFLYRRLPETKGKTLEQIEEELG